MGLFGNTKQPEQPKDRPAMLSDLATLNENVVILGERVSTLIQMIDAFTRTAQPSESGNGHNPEVKPKEKSPTEKVVELLGKGIFTDVEIGEKVGSPLPSVKKILTMNFESGDIPGLANLGKGKWTIIPVKEEAVEKTTD
jgi:hypothetical protein